MSEYNQCVILNSWGIDIAPYVGLTITPDEYKWITGNDYAAGAKA